ncbi:cytidine deaminase-like protein [Cavenderia fasciculata]|uniref:Cytidine deaminase-like protein n=1 Tax=Cavenderia fasciculata TaxID=261658 RepID=F4PGP3_CACFS|nr:cytidine deaminase-like protein [Cavenderia fasciculata]EGG24877.1 cytidine deaminase-like protein [Cavenderia fasciculata]|eukprot:XP_004362728.1 cytidine deaminase-like protein [Cavenderia fasciculata]
MSKRKIVGTKPSSSMCKNSQSNNTISSTTTDDDSHQETSSSSSLKEQVKEIQETRESLDPVLSFEEARDLEFSTIWVTNVDPKLASSLNSQLSKYIQTNHVYKDIQENFGHIKKLRKMTKDNKTYLEVFLCTVENYPHLIQDIDENRYSDDNANTDAASSSSSTSSISSISSSSSDLLHKYDETDYQSFIVQFLRINNLNKPYKVDIPKYAPLHLSQCPKWNAIWPCTYKYHPFSTPLVENLEDREIRPMKQYMKLAIEQANIAKSKGYRPIGGVLVDPNTNTTIISSHDSIPIDPQQQLLQNNNQDTKPKPLLSRFLSHCTMNILHELSQLHRELYGKPNINNNNSNNRQQQQQPDNIVKKDEKVEQAEEDDEEEEEEEEQYLANSYHLYLSREPCVMCSMALVHSRIERVIYGSQQHNGGGLGSCFRIHTEKSVNHKFQVYRGLMEKECLELFSPVVAVEENGNQQQETTKVLADENIKMALSTLKFCFLKIRLPHSREMVD